MWLFAEPLAGVLDRRSVDTVKPVLAAAAAALLLLDGVLMRRGRAPKARRAVSLALALLALGSGLAWWNLMQFHYPRHLHVSDTFHYYVGSKYFDELGYVRLYRCVALADAEAGGRSVVSDRILRDLENNALIAGRDALAAPELCKGHFSPARWRAFAADVGWFRSRVTPARWAEIQRDHGYNPPPAWTLVGSALANTAPAGAVQVGLLTLLDPLLLAAMFAAIGWAFGSRALCVAAVFFGTNLFGVFGWTGGSFLRQLWLVAALSGIACLRRGRAGAAGALLALATALRIFPGAILGALALRSLAGVLGRRRWQLAPEERRLYVAAACTLAAVFAVSSFATGGPSAWADFAANSRVHLATALKNHVGLATVAAYDAAHVDRRIRGGDAVERYARWSEARRERFAEREGVLRALQLAFLVLLALSVARQPAWAAAVLGVGAIPVAFELTNYYWAVLTAYAFLAPARWGVGVALCALSAASWWLAGSLQWRDEIMVACSALVVAFVVVVTASLARRPLRDRLPAPGTGAMDSTG